MQGNNKHKEFKRLHTNSDGLIDLNCKYCNKTNYKHVPSVGIWFCSYSCYEKYKRDNAKPNTTCIVCGKEFYLKDSRIDTRMPKHGFTCSRECSAVLRSDFMKGDGNHQYGLTGELNASFVGQEQLNQYGYIMMYLPNHPKADKNGRYRKHRYIIEQSDKYPMEYFDIINDQKVLKDTYDVHHRNENKLDCDLNNLIVLTRSEHTSLHNSQKEIIRDELGRIIGVVKKGEFSESLEEDNTEPSVTNERNSSNEGAEHSS